MALYYWSLLIVAAEPGALLREITPRRLATAALIVMAAVLAVRYIDRVVEVLSARNPGARFALKWTEHALRLAISFGSILVTILVLAPNSDAFLAAMGSAAIAIALGAQDLIKNLTGGLVILTDRPYQLGDRVKIGNTIGEVVHIGLRSTKLRTPDDSRVTVANSDLLTGQVENANYGVPECQAVTTIYVPTETDPDQLLRIAYESAWCSPYLQAERPVVVNLTDEYTESPYMQMRIKAYVFDHRYVERMQTDITSRVKKQLAKTGILANWNH